jgi:DMSO/TMAO reductase YedYZ molybdopterin-dependent catalytic subunit
MCIWHSERREKERQARAEGRLPPGQSLTEKFPVLTYEPPSQWPRIKLDGWELDVYGEVQRPLRFTHAELVEEFAVVELTFDIHCVTRWSKLGTTWHGVRVRDVLERAGLTDRARYLISHSYTGYTANVPIENALKPTSLITWEYDGMPLPPEHGGPVRVIIDPENLYFWKSTKFLRALEVVERDTPGFWERLGYHNRGNIWREERFWEDSSLHTRRDVVRSAEERS